MPVVISEWGSVNADGDGAVDYKETQRWLDFMRDRKLTHLNWSVHNKPEGASIFNPDAPTSGDWNDDHLTVSGRLIKTIVQSWDESDCTIGSQIPADDTDHHAATSVCIEKQTIKSIDAGGR